MNTGVLLGVISAISIGAADFLAVLSNRKIGVFFTLLYSMIISVIITVAAQSIFKYPFFKLEDIWIVLVVGIISAIGYFIFYKAIHFGPVSLVTPISSTDGAVALLIGILFFSEVITQKQLIALMIILISVFFVSTDFREIKVSFRQPKKGVQYAFITTLTFGIILAAISWLSQRYEWLMPILGLRAVMVAALLVVCAFRKDKKPEKKLGISGWSLVAAMGILETVGFLAYSCGISITAEAPTTTIAPICAAFPVTTIILSHIFLKERIVFNQYMGVGGIIIGMIVLSI